MHHLREVPTQPMVSFRSVKTSFHFIKGHIQLKYILHSCLRTNSNEPTSESTLGAAVTALREALEMLSLFRNTCEASEPYFTHHLNLLFLWVHLESDSTAEDQEIEN